MHSTKVGSRTAKLQNSSFVESACVLTKDHARVQRRDDAIFSQKSREKICKISGNPARSAHKNCVHSTSVRCAFLTTSLRVDRVSNAFRSEKESIQRRDHANFAPNSREKKMQNPRNFSARRAHKTCVNSASVVSRTAKLQSSYFSSRRAV